MTDCLSCFPPGAAEVLVRIDEKGAYFEYQLNGEVVGTLSVSPDGEKWAQAIRDSQRHGPERNWNPHGVLVFESFHENGREHGTARQWADDGTLIGTCHLEHGTGVDLWRSNVTWTLSEEHHQRDGRLHGFDRWWNKDERTVHEESHYHDGHQHGVFRRWNAHGRLSRGYPKYYVYGQQVSKKVYMRACRGDTTLPVFRAEDNRPERPLPQEYLDQVAQGIGPRRCGECGHILGSFRGSLCPECGEVL